MYSESEKTGSENEIVVIGAAGIDLVGRLTEMPDLGSSVPAEVRPSFGGVARNVAENLSKLDQKVTFISAVGNNVFGTLLLSHLSENGVNTDACIISDNFYTSSYLAVLAEDGSLSFALDDMRVMSDLTPKTIHEQEEIIKKAACVFFDANVPEDTIAAIIKIANQYQIPIYADATSRSLAKRIQPFLQHFKLLNANMSEMEILIDHKFEITGRTSALKAARILVNQGVEMVVIPMADLGVCYATYDTSGHVPAIKTKILDPTGAGDALSAALIFGILNDIPIDDTIRLGVMAASLTLHHPGTVLPSISVEKLYDMTMN
ncbi:MAG: carbohydrate kinase family protein [Anaerolineaceae bacterium]|nr:carbohydrate kinase family protein [Anaerolineaceae bacterium]